jgi:predicted DNA-binding mobile mystery protein A
MKNQWLTIKQLDRQLKEWQTLNNKYGKPRAGWIKTLRKALSMSSIQLAHRLKLSRARIVQLENAETHGAVTLRTLRETADALGCELVYALVPKGNSSLESIIKTRAEQVAKERVANVAHSMSLESQSVDADMLQLQKDELVKNLTEHLNKKFWTATPEKRDKQTDLRAKLLKNLKKKK